MIEQKVNMQIGSITTNDGYIKLVLGITELMKDKTALLLAIP